MPDRGRERGANDADNERLRGARRLENERDDFRGERGRGRHGQQDMSEQNGERDRRNGMDRAQTMPLAVASAFNDTYVSALERSASLIGNNLRLLQGQTMRFMSERLQRDAEIFQELGQARNLMDVFAVQQRWLNDVATSYSQEFMRLSRLTTSAAEEGLATGRSVGRRMNEAGEEFAEDMREQSRSMSQQQPLQ